MTSTAIMTDTVSGGVLVDLISYENVYIKQGVSAGSIGDAAIEATGNDHYIQVMGDLFGTGSAILIGSDIDSVGNDILIGAAGSVSGMPNGNDDIGRYGGTAISIFGTDSQIINRGQVFGENTGIEIISTGGGDGLKASAVENADALIANQGKIQGLNIGINHQAHETLTIKNRGSIEGGQYAIAGGSGVENVVNRGTIIGDIDLGKGNDIYDGRKSDPIEGTVIGGSGNDMLTGGRGSDWLDGSSGMNTLVGGTGSDVFLFDTTLVAGNITDLPDFESNPFDPAHDWIALDHNIFSAIRPSDFHSEPSHGDYLRGHIHLSKDGTLSYYAGPDVPRIAFAHLPMDHLGDAGNRVFELV